MRRSRCSFLLNFNFWCLAQCAVCVSLSQFDGYKVDLSSIVLRNILSAQPAWADLSASATALRICRPKGAENKKCSQTIRLKVSDESVCVPVCVCAVAVRHYS